MTHCARHKAIPSTRASLLIISIVLLFTLATLSGCDRNASGRIGEYGEVIENARRLFSEGHTVQSLVLLKGLLSGSREAGFDSLLAESYHLAAQCEERLGQYENALADFKRSMEYARGVSDQRLERLNKISLAQFYFAMGDFPLARILASESAAGARVFSDTTMLFGALLLSADADGRSGEADRALRTIGELERMVDSSRNREQRLSLMRLRFETLLASERGSEIRETLARWKSVNRTAPDRSALMMAAYCGGIYQELLAHPDSALALYSEALTLFDAPAAAFFAPDLFVNLGNVAYQLRHFADARRYYADALERATSAGNGALEPMLSLAIAACDWNIGRRQPGAMTEEVIGRCTALLAVCRERRIPRGEACAQFLLGVFAEQKGDPAGALTFYRTALETARRVSSRVSDPSPVRRTVDALLSGEQSGWFKAPIRLQAALHDGRAVFEGIERETLDDIGEFFLESSLHPADEGLRASIDQLRWKRRLALRCGREIEEELAKGKEGNPERSAALREAYPALAEGAERAAQELNASSANLRWIVAAREVSLRAVQDTMPAGSSLLEYSVAPKVLTIVVVRKDTVIIRNVSIDRSNLLGMISEYNRIMGDAKISADGTLMQSASAPRRIRDLASILSDVLIDPVLSDLRRSETLYIVPPSEFGWLPFHTLNISGRVETGESGGRSWGSLIERYAVRYLPSAAMLFCSQAPGRFVRTVAGIGHPGVTNWDVEYELKDIRSFYEKARMYFDTAATLSRLSRVDSDVLHIAADVSLSSRGSDRLAVVLSDGSTPYGLSRVPLGALATLPAQQALLISNASAVPGGLNRYAPALFLAGGNRTVIATMWRGDRKAKRLFGEIFYTNLTTGLPAEDAYRSAVLALIKKSEYAARQRWGLYFQFGR